MFASKRASSALLFVAATLALPASAQDTVSFNYVGSWSGLGLFKEFEQPFWAEALPASSDGRIETQVTTFDQMGLKGGEVFRLLSRGVFDIGATVADYTVQDAPELEGLDLPMLAPEAEQAFQVAKAYKPVLDDALQQRFNAKLLAVVPYPSQMLFCNAPIESMADLDAKQIRASGRSTAEFVEALGAEGITMSFSEVPGALERGVVDCAITGSLSGYSAGWHEISTHLYPLPMGGWDHVVTAMNLDRWNELDAELQAQILSAVESQLETPVWRNAPAQTQAGVGCLTGTEACPYGEPGSMTPVVATEADFERARQVLQQTLLPNWAGRVDADWVARWNDTIGQVVDLQADAAPE
ncbi:MAG: TRAP transporter substrate-binding protein [Candidatus Competibacterales bacterium]